MKKYNEMEQMVERFLDGETTLAEERAMELFFSEHRDELPEMPESLRIVAEMFSQFEQQRKAKRFSLSPRFRRIILAAAAILAFVVFAGISYSYIDTTDSVNEKIAKTEEKKTAVQIAKTVVCKTEEAIQNENVAQTDRHMKRKTKTYDKATEETATKTSEENHAVSLPDPFLIHAAVTEDIRSHGEQLENSISKLNEPINI